MIFFEIRLRKLLDLFQVFRTLFMLNNDDCVLLLFVRVFFFYKNVQLMSRINEILIQIYKIPLRLKFVSVYALSFLYFTFFFMMSYILLLFFTLFTSLFIMMSYIQYYEHFTTVFLVTIMFLFLGKCTFFLEVILIG